MLDLSNPAFRAVQERFEARTRDYRRRLDELATILEAGAPDVLAEVKLIAHRLAGSAATFGHPALGRAARQLDDTLGTGRDDPAIVRARVADLVAAIESSLARTSPA